MECTICQYPTSSPFYFTGCSKQKCHTILIYCGICLDDAIENHKVDLCPVCRSHIKITRKQVPKLKRPVTPDEIKEIKARDRNADSARIAERDASISTKGAIFAEFEQERNSAVRRAMEESLRRNPGDSEIALKFHEHELKACGSKNPSAGRSSIHDDEEFAKRVQKDLEDEEQRIQRQYKEDEELARRIQMEEEKFSDAESHNHQRSVSPQSKRQRIEIDAD